MGFYGGTLENPPGSPNLVVPPSGMVVCDITLAGYTGDDGDDDGNGGDGGGGCFFGNVAEK
jgi:hypothetical protein